MMALQILTYISLATAIIAMITKAARYAFAPEHLRWELYPVPHEKGRAEYGGSYLEELDWWSKPRQADWFKEVVEMMAEIFLLRGVYRNNKRVWIFSFPFHFGMYLCISWLGLLLFGAALEKFGLVISAEASGVSVIIYYLTIASGYAGLIISCLGAIGLLIWRASDSNQKPYNSPAEFINLSFFILTVIVTLVAQILADPAFNILRAYVGSLVTFSAADISSIPMIIEIVLVSLLLMYIPLTRMSHFVAKYFLYHSVRWNDKPNAKGSAIEKHIEELLRQKVNWKAPHIVTGKSWLDTIKDTKDE